MPVFVFTTFGAPVASFARRQPEMTGNISSKQEIPAVILINRVPI
jgi:hypothetical protein